MSEATSRAGISAEQCTEDTAPDTRTAHDGRKAPAAEACEPCRVAADTGWWNGSIPRNHTQCRDCHVTWPGSNKWGHSPRCHQTFAGTVASDLHQRVGRDGDMSPDCLCWVLTAGLGEATVDGAPLQRKWAVSGSRTLVSEFGAWGPYWTLVSDLSGVFE